MQNKDISTWHDHSDCPGPITNLGLSKIGNFGQVQPLWRKNNKHREDRQNILLVKVILLYVK